jgi:hypothetical protein
MKSRKGEMKENRKEEKKGVPALPPQGAPGSAVPVPPALPAK